MRECDQGSMGARLVVTSCRFHGSSLLMCYYCLHSICNSINGPFSKYTHIHNSGIPGSVETS